MKIINVDLQSRSTVRDRSILIFTTEDNATLTLGRNMVIDNALTVIDKRLAVVELYSYFTASPKISRTWN